MRLNAVVTVSEPAAANWKAPTRLFPQKCKGGQDMMRHKLTTAKDSTPWNALQKGDGGWATSEAWNYMLPSQIAAPDETRLDAELCALP